MYGVDRLDTEKPHTVMFYNMGGIDTEVSIVRYSSITDPTNNKTFEHIEILAESYVKQYGGFDLDIVLMNLLAERFNALKERKGKADVRTNERVVRRILKEVVRVKDVLSANKNMQVKLGELLDYVTLLTTVERKEFEDAGAAFFEKVMVPVHDVLSKAGMTVDQID